MVERKLKGTLADIFVGLFEDVPFFALNVYSIFTTKRVEPVIMFSTFVTTCNIGYKLSMIKAFFTFMQEKQAIKEQIGGAGRMSIMPIVEQANGILNDNEVNDDSEESNEDNSSEANDLVLQG